MKITLYVCVEGVGGKDRIKNESQVSVGAKFSNREQWVGRDWLGWELVDGCWERVKSTFVCNVLEMAMKYNKQEGSGTYDPGALKTDL